MSCEFFQNIKPISQFITKLVIFFLNFKLLLESIIKIRRMSKLLQVLIILIAILVCKCQKTINLLNVNISYTYNPSSTTFEINFPFPTGLSNGNAWVALGFNTIQDMVIYKYIIIYILQTKVRFHK
jgi:hypothetical protein